MPIIEQFSLYFLMIILPPLVGFLINLLFFKKKLFIGAQIASISIWIGFMNALIAWCKGLPFFEKIESSGFIANEISWLIATLILFVSGIVHQFSLHYMAGDRNYRRYFVLLSLITISTLLMVASDHIVLFISFWSLSNLILAFLMMHKLEWEAAKNSGILAIKTFVLCLFFLSAGIGLLAYESGAVSLSLITESSQGLSSSTRMIALCFILLAALSQSGCWPFHNWLISSLNSPTPISSFMHAGLVNGGGLLLARFAPIFLHEGLLLNVLFVLAVVTVILGGIWKLLQTDVKRMLACSTIAQMGFMMMQCGLGLFPAALAHLCWHGLFKAFLFLKSGSTIAEHRHTNQEKDRSIFTFFLSVFCGLIGAKGFIIGSDLSFNFVDTTSVLIFFAWMASSQFAHTLLERQQKPLFILTASALCLTTGYMYGLTVGLIELAVTPLQISQPQPLNLIHLMTISFIFCIWIGLNLKPSIHYEESVWWRRFYVRMLNASQPDPKTMTLNKNAYKF